MGPRDREPRGAGQRHRRVTASWVEVRRVPATQAVRRTDDPRANTPLTERVTLIFADVCFAAIPIGRLAGRFWPNGELRECPQFESIIHGLTLSPFAVLALPGHSAGTLSNRATGSNRTQRV